MIQRGFGNVRFVAGLALAGFMLVAAGCQSGDGDGILGLRGKSTQPPPPKDGKVLASELLAYCPRVTLREGTAYFNTYAKGGEDDKSKIIYQASIRDVTRNCSRANGMLNMNVAVAGKVVAGPLGTDGTVTMPIRIVVAQGTDVLYSQLHQYQVQVSATGAAAQFVFNDPNVSIPVPTQQNLQVFAGFDEGPPKKKKAEEIVDDSAGL